MIQELCEDIGSLEIMYLSEQALEGMMHSFNSYVTMMIHALPSSVDTENLEGSTRRIVKMAETEMGNMQATTSAALLLLPSKFCEEELYAKVCSLSYMDDLRMLFAEDKNKSLPPDFLTVLRTELLVGCWLILIICKERSETLATRVCTINLSSVSMLSKQHRQGDFARFKQMVEARGICEPSSSSHSENG
ncbi:hypothetical protein ACS0TY_024183 [Phlomoides rotata]